MMKSVVRKVVQKSQKAQSLVEFAVILTLLLVLLAGVVDLGRVFFAYIGMRDAAQEGIVYGSVNPTHCHQIEGRVRDNLTNPETAIVDTNIDGEICAEASKDNTRACLGNEIEVKVIENEFPITMPFLGTVLGKQSIRLEASVSGTILRPACSSGP
jgi:hypothetical protein